MNRHTGHHINALEEYFKEHSHPNELQRNELALRLGMHPTQVMCWFRNKRTQLRSQSKREENELLKSENNMLPAQIQHFTEVLSKNICPQCGVSSSQQYVDENILRSENIHLREESKWNQHLEAIWLGRIHKTSPTTFEDSQNPSVISQNPQDLHKHA
ncbi:hypothetical protein POM88_005948 [Heracleum sosnowskyi]|uniref:Homeobox domain-containing protein n=1 Tax=Heracleum sosnowskyi TaxID=360622 RepID=A0AAD8J5E6_9APIA|nr:hypothetical protein POM88_005948 [Heracleum sosnowskyi]